jgi:hypothetical protein
MVEVEVEVEVVAEAIAAEHPNPTMIDHTLSRHTLNLKDNNHKPLHRQQQRLALKTHMRNVR